MSETAPAKKRGRTRQTRRTQRTRRRLMDAARAVFVEKGLDLARIDEITNRADVGKGTFYYHFRTKDGIVREVIKDVMHGLVEAITDKCREAKDVGELLDRLIGAHIAFFSNRWEDFVLYFQGRTDLTLGEGYEGIQTPFMEYLETVEGLLDSVIRQRLPAPALRRIACAVAGFVSGYYSFAVISFESEDVDRAFGSLRGAFVAGLTRFIQEASPHPPESAAQKGDLHHGRGTGHPARNGG